MVSTAPTVLAKPTSPVPNHFPSTSSSSAMGKEVAEQSEGASCMQKRSLVPLVGAPKEKGADLPRTDIKREIL